MTNSSTSTALPTDKPTPAERRVMPSPCGYRLNAPEIVKQTRENFIKADLPEVNDTLIAAETERAAKQVRAGTPLPLDVNESKGDDYLLQDLATVRERKEKLKGLLDGAREEVERTRRVLAALAKPLTQGQWFAVVGAVGAVTVIGVLALKALLWTSFAETLLTPFF
jgi:hypothetical protein